MNKPNKNTQSKKAQDKKNGLNKKRLCRIIFDERVKNGKD